MTINPAPLIARLRLPRLTVIRMAGDGFRRRPAFQIPPAVTRDTPTSLAASFAVNPLARSRTARASSSVVPGATPFGVTDLSVLIRSSACARSTSAWLAASGARRQRRAVAAIPLEPVPKRGK